MGLDMYLTKRTYVKNWDHHPEEQHYDISVKQGGEVVTHIQPVCISYIIEEVGYWRKANAIHMWFVKNCQGGEDDCRDAYVDIDRLKELLEIVQTVIASRDIVDNASKAEELLPTSSGFFFGSTDYNEYYIDNLKLTVKILIDALADGGKGEFYYRSSW